MFMEPANCETDGHRRYYVAGPTDALRVGREIVADVLPVIVSDHPDLDAGNYVRGENELENWRIWRVEVPAFRLESFGRHGHVGFADRAMVVEEMSFDDTFPWWPSLVALARQVEAMRQHDVERLALELEHIDLRHLRAEISGEVDRLGAARESSRAATTIDWLGGHAALREDRARGTGLGVERLTEWLSSSGGGDELLIHDVRWVTVIDYVAVLGSTFPIRSELDSSIRSAIEAPFEAAVPRS